MKANFLRLRELLQREFPGQWNSIQGDNYPAPEWTSYVAPVISAVQMFAMVLILMGDSVWTYVPGFQRPPEFYYKMKANPALTFIIVFLVIPAYVQSFANTGAFEVYVDEKLIFSKLETGRMPNVPEIVRSLENAGLTRGA
mmetsp:Transcript_54102/g.114925  ORF Transcript_54102/g.114925 Transcript_54102/m.114925 type:complete len:141 (-) Transcript_54102:358-780(-)|eukprot:CAMPEP_0172551308 /NCGR_PEP_ID=MMETSP1067-20121228/37878_1 /TAXON_ID=265564 ORGANISM="Thalassiosira punctigera, Strain Tpunct2005C2" /NCGR_SAMPLE_ID=MMETSP1067 /ASSEMBLY_ACC=CAM_ASM_000444 /LENGTH=140 /DNA_ID=CAMNT_0013339077 /DNA_START=224 /DNA_END=646 /DNA_ORIENTATION=+